MPLSTNALTNLTTVYAELGLDSPTAAETALLTRYINFASDVFQTLIDRKLPKATYEAEKLTTSYQTKAYLKQYPILSVSSFTIDDTDYDYEIVSVGEEGSFLYNEDGFLDSSRIYGDLVRSYYGERTLNAEADYVAGYITPKQEDESEGTRTLPYDIEEAIIQAVAIKFKEQCSDTQGMRKYQVGSRSFEFKEIFEGIYDDIIQKYKRPEQ